MSCQDDDNDDNDRCRECGDNENVQSTYCGSFCEFCLSEHVEYCDVCAEEFA